ncbi:MAG: Type I Iterative PKS [Bathelium mastoideum]|nr:MAG: Type I Iterative PKS [Bathelium mastoideum]
MAHQSSNAIAIVGMSCRFPGGANDPTKLWSMLSEGRNAWSDVPPDRFEWKAFYHPSAGVNGTTNHRGGHFLDQDIATFDASFFGIHPSEAHAIDPQQRIQLETAYEAFENAGMPLESIKGSNTAVYVAIFSRDYDRSMYKDTSNLAKYHMIGTGDAITSNRLSYVFDLKGPSMTIDTGCSGSLVALHQACQSLRMRESNMALVGGTNLILAPDAMVPMSLLGILNPDGRCYTFDTRGSGYGRGEGVAAVVLKRLDDALLAGDPIRAIIRDTGVNQDGKTMGIAVPNQEAQRTLMHSMYSRVGIHPGQIGYVEAHGTGTKAGDACEFESISDVFCNDRNQDTPLYIGSVKTNIGHLEAASGIAGLIKTVLVLENRQIPPNLNLEHFKDGLAFSERDIRVARMLEPLPEYARYASVNSYGYGGTNAHCILEAAPSDQGRSLANGSLGRSALWQAKESPNGLMRVNGHTNGANGGFSFASVGETRPDDSNKHDTAVKDELRVPLKAQSKQLLVISAKSRASLIQTVSGLAGWATNRAQDDPGLQDLSYTLCCRRSFLRWRCSIVATSYENLVSQLNTSSLRMAKASPQVQIIFVFTGQGAQWAGMGRELAFTESPFRESLLKADKILKGLGSSWSLLRDIIPTNTTVQIDDSRISQPYTTALQIAMVDLMEAIGVRPDLVMGHSSGEIAAAYAAGALSQAAALSISYYRGFISDLRKQSSQERGSMLAVGLGEDEVSAFIRQLRQGKVSVACVNSPVSVTVSGDETAVAELQGILNNMDVFNRRLKVDLAYHSHHMQIVANDYQRLLSAIKSEPSKASVQFFSSVTGTEKNSDFGPSYWVDNLVSTVRFSDALDALCRTQQAKSIDREDMPLHTFIEVGPHKTLSGPIQQTMKQFKETQFPFTYIPTLIRDRDAVLTTMEAAGQLFEVGTLPRFQVLNSITPAAEKVSLVLDLPPYAWDHSSRYWHESWLSKEHRLRRHAYHDLLGIRVVGSPSTEPRWRHNLSTNSLPWLRDHVVDGFVIFPGAGYLCMAIEALNQVMEDREQRGTRKFVKLRDVAFHKALIVPESPATVEVHLALRSCQYGNTRNSSGWENFVISSVSSNGLWSEHCHGSIMTEFDAPSDETEELHERDLWISALRDNFKSISDACLEPLSSSELYGQLKSGGNFYGPTFATLQDIRIGRSNAVGKVVIPDIAFCMPANFMQPHLIHPCVLDSLLQISLPLFSRECSSGSVVPTAVKELIISPDVISSTRGELFVSCTLHAEGRRSANTDITAFQIDKQSELKPVIVISQGELCGLGSQDPEDSKPREKMTFQMKWGTDVDCLNSAMLATSTSKVSQESLSSQTQKSDLLDRATYIYVNSCLTNLANKALKPAQDHFAYLLDWMQHWSRSDEHMCELSNLDEKTRQSILQQARHEGVEGEAIARIGENLTSILTGDIEPLSILLADGLLYRLYQDDSSLRCCTHLVEYMRHLIFKKPQMSILEIGAGTGGTTLPLMRALSSSPSTFRKYDFTDISSGFFATAQSALEEWSGMVQYQTLDIERDPAEQGFEVESYDLIIAANVLHATSSLDKTISNVRKLLKPGGKLALIEMTRLVPGGNIIFGLLPGWWKGIEIAANDFEGPAGKTTLMISAASSAQGFSMSTMNIEILSKSVPENQLSEALGELIVGLEEQGFQVKFSSWSSHQRSKDTVYLIWDSGQNHLLLDPSAEDFRNITALLAHAERVLWIVERAGHSEDINPEAGLVTGFARVARSESERLSLITFDIRQGHSSKDPKVVSSLCRVCATAFIHNLGNGGQIEYEYAYEHDMLIIPRLIPDDQLDARVAGSKLKRKQEQCLFRQKSKGHKLHVESPGLLDSLVFVEDEALLQPIGASEIEVEVKACGINFKDVFVALGQMKASTKMAGECAGIVTSVGSDAQPQFQVGDRVCAWNGTPYASRTRVRGVDAFAVPDSMTLTEAASVPVIFGTAFYSLVSIADLQRDQSILIHAASGGVGQAAIMIAQHIGARIFATAGTESKRKLIVEKYGIPESHVFSSRSTTFKDGLLRLTQGEGIDVVLNSTSGEALRDTWECIAPFGTFVELGKSDIYRKSQLSMEPFDRNVNFASVDLVVVANRRPEILKEIMKKVFALFAIGSLRAVYPIKIMEVSNIEGAFRYIQARKHTGKVVLEVRENSMVKVIPTAPKPLQLEEHGTYVIAGGLGNLGLSICEFMVTAGAKHVVLLSRRHPEKMKIDEFRARLGSLGARIHTLRCDITDSESVHAAAAFCRKTLPPVRGIIQAAMVLQDRILEQMSDVDFKTALKPKVTGTQYLDDAFHNSKLDFFIMLSSIACIIGSRSQANYASGNAFQDAFAQEQSQSGTHYLSVNLGFVEGSDAITSHHERRAALIRAGSLPISVDHVLRLLSYGMSAEARQDNCKQAAIGFNRESIIVHSEQVLKSPLFSHFRDSTVENTAKSTTASKAFVDEAITKAASFDEASNAISAALAKQLSVLLALEYDMVSWDTSMADFGLDSLIAIELKNWIGRTLQAAIQTSEVLDAASIRALTKIIAERSSLLTPSKTDGETVPEEPEKTPQVTAGQRSLPANRHPQNLPAYPLPMLEDTLQLYLESVTPFRSAEELSQTFRAIQEFQKPHGFGQQLQKRLEQRASDPSIENWLAELYDKHVYLNHRVPVNPLQHFYGSHVDSKIRHSQAERAAIIAVTAFQFKENLEAGKILPDVLNEDQLCMSSLPWLFNSSREPCRGTDVVHKYPDNDYCIALRRGHYFKVMLRTQNDGGMEFPSVGSLRRTFEHILEATHGWAPPVAALTADERNTWSTVGLPTRFAQVWS